jgi:GT2 family glycosyltransferase
VSGATRVRTEIAAWLRRVTQRPRKWLSAFRAHRSTDAAIQAAGSTWERGAVAVYGNVHRRARRRDWNQLLDAVGALPLVDPPNRSVAMVRLATDGSRDAHSVIYPDAELVCVMLDSATTLEPGCVARLVAAIDGTAVTAAVPLVVHPLRSTLRATPYDGRVRARGVSIAVANDAPALQANDAGAIATPSGSAEPVPAATAACVVVDRGAYEAAGGLAEVGDHDLAVFDLCRRLHALGGAVVVVPDAVVVDHRPVHSRLALEHPVDTNGSAWRAYVDDHGPALFRAAVALPAGMLRVALTVAAPSAKVASRWGDWHLAQAFARAIRAQGHVVRVQTLDHADDPAGRACDVHCVIRGLADVRRTAGQAHVIWVISHPEAVTDAECDRADLVLVASERFAEALRARTRTPVDVMLQATDAHRFQPVPADPAQAHDVVVVAKSRDVFRSVVADAIAAGLRPAIYGSGWEAFVDPTLVVSAYVPNEELPVVYSSAGVLLNDHWASMHEWGFVSNRLFDALACETPVISDDLPEIAPLFGGAVLTYHDATDLRSLVDATLADRAGARARAARGRRIVITHHTFDLRARQFLAALDSYGLSRRAPS